VEGGSVAGPKVHRKRSNASYEAGAEDAGSGELLVETLDLTYAL
jgi:hypothetical protein